MSDHTDAPSDVDRYVGSRMRELRQTRRLTQEKLAEAVGVSFQQIQKYETGENRISASRLFLVTAALGVDLNAMFAGVRSQIGSTKDAPSHQDFSELRDIFDDLTESRRKLVLNMARALSNAEPI